MGGTAGAEGDVDSPTADTPGATGTKETTGVGAAGPGATGTTGVAPG
ncbi:MAG: hypothetical protein NTX50_07370 [Candidatus Sumerlaeota bacterium]|nr:hypothetical protein [Candidatus Sumerlaeota bacterium]